MGNTAGRNIAMGKTTKHLRSENFSQVIKTTTTIKVEMNLLVVKSE